MYRSSPFRSTLNTGINMFPFQVCTEASDAFKNAKNWGPRAKTARGKKGTKARKGCVSGSANVPVCGYIYIPGTIYKNLRGLYGKKNFVRGL